MLLQLDAVSHSFGATPILTNISFVLNRGDHVGLVGANGCGKSTLLKIIVGQLEPEAGTVRWDHAARYAYLPQQLTPPATQTISGMLRASQAHLEHMQQRMQQLEAAMAHAHDEQLATLLHEYGPLAERFEQSGGYEREYQIELVLEGLRLSHLPRSRTVSSLSGGEKTRLGLAAVLLSQPDVLLLDEPTNHLDFTAAAWLEQYLAQLRGGLLVVSHDRMFLNRAVTQIAELDEHAHQLKLYPGNYDAYSVEKVAERVRWSERYARQQEEIKELQLRTKASTHQIGHNRGPRDGDKIAYKAAGQRVQRTLARNIRAAQEALDRILADPIPEPPQPLEFRPSFIQPASSSTVILAVAAVSFGYAAQPVLSNVSFTLGPQSRMLIVGQNGAGKTTLLRLLQAELQPHTGSIQLAPSTRVGYLRQELDPADASQTVFAAYRAGRSGYDHELMAELLSWGLFSYPETQRLLGQLSLGQRQKLQIARILAVQPNLLILDEPTNHISLAVLEQFEAALRTFPGAIIAISHDRWFIERFGGTAWLLEHGQLTSDAERVEQHLGQTQPA